MHDAIALANLIYALPSSNTKEVTQAFSEYQSERLPPAIDAYETSLMLSKLLKGGITGAIALLLVNYMPKWLWHIVISKMIINRPQVGFIPPVEDRGTLPPKVSPSTEKARAMFNKRNSVSIV